MKKIVFLMLIIAATFLTAPADTYTIDRDALPEAAREMLAEHFPKAKIGMIKVDKHLLKKTDYDVRLVNGTKIEFSNSGKWTSVDCKSREVPSGLIPRTIRNYISKNYNDVTVVKIEKKVSGYKVGLSDGVELKFSLLGQFKGVELDD